jgi:hypothetical protein
MKKQLFLLLLILVFAKTNAQNILPFAIIKDVDGFTNIRSENLKTVIDVIKNNQVFADAPGMEEKNGSVNIDYPDWKQGKKSFELYINKTKSGYINKTRVQYLSDLPQFQEKVIANKTIIFTKGDIKIVLEIGIFDPKKHKLELAENSAVIKIDGSENWGTDGILYKNLREIKSITATYKGKSIPFPKEAIKNLFMPTTNPDHVGVAESTDNTLFLFMSNSDGAGSYDVVWTIKNGIAINQFIHRGF